MKAKNIFLIITLYAVTNWSNGVFCQNIGINVSGNVANPKALLDIDATGMSPKAGLLLPRMTTAERDAISGTIPESLLIYNTTTGCYEGYYAPNTSWVAFGCIGCQLPGTFSASAATSIAPTSFSANWSTSAGATAYYLDVSTSSAFASFVTGYNNLSVGNVTTYSVNSNLNCGTTYYYRLRANNSCGTSANSNTVLVNTIACCPATLAINHTVGTVAPETKSVTYGVVQTNLSGSYKCWITQNLGSTNQAGTSTDATDASAGWYWQFNRKQGYKVGPTPAWTITSISESSDWLAANDPCTIELGSGWRIPTSTEWSNAIVNGGWNNLTDVYNSVLKLHAAGLLNTTDGTLLVRGANGYIWSSVQSSSANGLDINTTGTPTLTGNPKAYGYSVRCIKD